GVFRIARPSRHDDAVDAERRDGEEIEDADIDVGNDDLAAVPSAERNHGPTDQRQNEGQQGREDEHHPVGAGGDPRFLEDQLHAVGDRLQQPEGTDDVGAAPKLYGRDHLALGIGEIGHHQHDRYNDGHDLDDQDDRRPRIDVPE